MYFIFLLVFLCRSECPVNCDSCDQNGQCSKCNIKYYL